MAQHFFLIPKICADKIENISEHDQPFVFPWYPYPPYPVGSISITTQEHDSGLLQLFRQLSWQQKTCCMAIPKKTEK